MNELTVSQSSEVKYNPTIWVDGAAVKKELRLTEQDDPKQYYYVYLQGDAIYLIGTSKYEKILSDIENGVKFVKINDDLININQIKRFKKNA